MKNIYGNYESIFQVLEESTQYMLHIGEFTSGNTGSGDLENVTAIFSTYEVDCAAGCGPDYQAGWWTVNCTDCDISLGEPRYVCLTICVALFCLISRFLLL